MPEGGTYEGPSLIEQQPEPNDATPFLPESRNLTALREAAAGCRGCHLWRGATQRVFGEGLRRARVVFVGEQPGDREDREGEPFGGRDRPPRRVRERAFAADLRLVAEALG